MLTGPADRGAGAPTGASLVTSSLVGHHVRGMQRNICSFGGFWFFYAGEGPA
jgi:hypothetical protein